MSKTKNKNDSMTPAFEEEQFPVEETPVPTPADIVEKPVVEKAPKLVTGTVVGCRKLNVRMQMHLGAKILCELLAASKVQVLVDEKHNEWYHVFTESGVEGYCMKQYISIKA
jgi:hypothetical protein